MQVFINYAHVDKAEAESVVEILKTGNHEVWFDATLNKQQDWQSQLRDFISQSDVFLHLLSGYSVTSQWCQWCLGEAVKAGKPVIIVLLQALSDLPEPFDGRDYADFSEGPTPAAAAQLVNSLYNPLKLSASDLPSIPENPTGTPAQAMRQSMVFISYSRNDEDYVKRLEAYLEGNGFSVWIDKGAISYGDQWMRQIKLALEGCAAYVVVMSPDSENSQWVQRELHYAEEHEKPIFPLLRSGKIWFQLGTTQVLDVTDDRMPPEAFLARLATVAPRETDAPGASPAAPAEPPKRCLFLASFAEDPVVEPYRDAVMTMLGADFKDDWEISAQSMMTSASASILNDTIADCDYYLALLGVFYGPPLNGETTSQLAHTLKQAREQGRAGLVCLMPPQVPPGISIEFLAEHGGAVKDMLALRRSIGADTGRLDIFEAETPTDLINRLRTALREHAKPASVPVAEAQTPPTPAPTPAEPRSTSFFNSDDHSHKSYDRRTLEMYDLEDLDQTLIERLLNRPLARELARRAKLDLPNHPQHLELLGLMEDDKITLAAFLCFAPIRLIANKYPACSLQMVVYSDVKRASSKAEIDIASDNLLNLWDTGLDFLLYRSGLRRNGTVGTEARDALEVPDIALRETFANALVHRDYEDAVLREQPTVIEVYPDRVEFTSFGDLPEGISVETLNENPEKAVSIRRNPAVASVFQYMSYMELNGSGISRMQEAMKAAGLPTATIVEDKDRSTVKVILQRPGSAATAEVVAVEATQTAEAAPVAEKSQPASSAPAKADVPAKPPPAPAKPKPAKKPAAPAKAKVTAKPRRKKSNTADPAEPLG